VPPKTREGPPGSPADARDADALQLVTARVGARIRCERERSGTSLRRLARRLGVSPSLLSQIERGLVKPSVGTLWTIVRELGLSLDELFAEAEGELDGKPAGDRAAAIVRPDEPAARVQRARGRSGIDLARGVRWERLAAGDERVDFVFVTYDVDASSSSDGGLVRHGGNEYGYVIRGRLGVQVGFHEYELEPGDAISFDAASPHRLWTVGDEPVSAVWFVVDRHGDERPAVASPSADW